MLEPLKKTTRLLTDLGFIRLRKNNYGRVDGDIFYHLKLPTGKSHCRIWSCINVLTDPLINLHAANRGLGGWMPGSKSDALWCPSQSTRKAQTELHSLIVGPYQTYLRERSDLLSCLDRMKVRVEKCFSVHRAFWLLTAGEIDEAMTHFKRVKGDKDYLWNPHGDEEREIEYYLGLEGSPQEIRSSIDLALEENRVENVYSFKLHKLFPETRFGKKARVPAVLRDESE